MMVNRTNLELFRCWPSWLRAADIRASGADQCRARRPAVSENARAAERLDRTKTERAQDPSEVAVHQIAENRWVRLYERRMRDGGMVAIRLDVSELMQHEQELSLLNRPAGAAEPGVVGAVANRCLDRPCQPARIRPAAGRGGIARGAPLHATGVAGGRYRPLQGVQRPLWPSGRRRLLAPSGHRASRMRGSADRPVAAWWRRFAVLLPHQGSADAVQVAERCLRAIEAAAIAHAGSSVAPHVTVSIGVAQTIERAQDGAHCSPQPMPRCTLQSGRVGVGSCSQ